MMATAKQGRRAAKKQRRATARMSRPVNGVDLSSRYVCDKCGLEQAVRHETASEATLFPEVKIAPCEGPLGLPCDGETATQLDQFPVGPYAEWVHQ